MKPIPLLKAKLTFRQTLAIVSFLHERAKDSEEYYDDGEASPKKIPEDPSDVIRKYTCLSKYCIVRLRKGESVHHLVGNPDDRDRTSKRKILTVTAKKAGLYFANEHCEFIFGPLHRKPRAYNF